MNEEQFNQQLVDGKITTVEIPAPVPVVSEEDDPIGFWTKLRSSVYGQAKNVILKIAYPVGSVYINADNDTNPAILFGFGTWEAFAAGRVMVGIDPMDADFDTAGETRGEKAHTLTGAESGEKAHTHSDGGHTHSDGGHGHGVNDSGHAHGPESGTTHFWMWDSNDNEDRATLGGGTASRRSSGTGVANANVSIQTGYASIGSSNANVAGVAASNAASAHNNIQPSIVVYAWKRTK